MSTKSPECYITDPQARCLRVETSPGRAILLPLDQFAFAEFTNEEEEQVLRLSFASHEIMVRGHALQRIGTALHKLELSFLMALPSKYYALVPDGQPKIQAIIVTEEKSKAEPEPVN